MGARGRTRRLRLPARALAGAQPQTARRGLAGAGWADAAPVRHRFACLAAVVDVHAPAAPARSAARGAVRRPLRPVRGRGRPRRPARPSPIPLAVAGSPPLAAGPLVRRRQHLALHLDDDVRVRPVKVAGRPDLRQTIGARHPGAWHPCGGVHRCQAPWRLAPLRRRTSVPGTDAVAPNGPIYRPTIGARHRRGRSKRPDLRPTVGARHRFRCLAPIARPPKGRTSAPSGRAPLGRPQAARGPTEYPANRRYPLPPGDDWTEPGMARILCVDDEIVMAKLIERMLRRSHAVEIATTLSTARSLLAEEDFDLMLLDVNMPGESGIDLLREVRSSHPETAVVLVTGVDSTE